MNILGIETSCDETAVAVVSDHGGRPRILANLVQSQLAEHAPYGGVVPEIAARAHLDHLDGLTRRALDAAGLGFGRLDGVAAAAGPGLIGGLIVGTMAAKGIAWATGKPFAAVNHLEAHALTARLSNGVGFPYLLLLVSGGHSQLLVCESVGRYRQLGTTLDDAAGEAFDKSAKLLGLPYPGGPALAARATHGNPRRFALPRPMAGRAGCDFSFSGLKTAVREAAFAMAADDAEAVADLAAAVELAICDCLVDRSARAARWFRARYPAGTALVAAGGVAANARLRARLAALAADSGLDFIAPPPALCTDNGAMIAWAGLERLRLGLADPLDAPVRPRWPLDPQVHSPKAPGHKAPGPKTPGPKALDPGGPGHKALGPGTHRPKAPGPQALDPQAPGPKAPGPKVLDPGAHGPKALDPQAPYPKTSGPKAPGLGAHGPKALDPKTPYPKTSGPKAPGLGAHGPKALDPKTPGPKAPGPEAPGPEAPGPGMPR